jgi:glycosyltransferase involved in cell wall biosynthesis
MIVRHFGPDPRAVGGMSSVIRLLTDRSVGGETVVQQTTWRPGSPLATVALFIGCIGSLARSPATELVHIHLSERGSFAREGLLLALARLRGLASVATIHGASFLHFAQRRPRLVSAILRQADLVTCLEHDVLDRVRELVPLVPSELVPNPVLTEESPSSADATPELVVFVGEIGLRKGVDVLCRAWSSVARRRPLARCVIVGPQRDFVPPTADRLDVRPPVGPIEMRELVLGARLVALPSRAEGLPMALTEAMSLGRPFVSTPVGGIPELAREGGMLVPVDDHAALADCLIELLGKPELAREIGERGRRYCAQTRSIETIDARLRALYAAVAAARYKRSGKSDSIS